VFRQPNTDPQHYTANEYMTRSLNKQYKIVGHPYAKSIADNLTVTAPEALTVLPELLIGMRWSASSRL
jgi:hypothetical protein